MFRGGGSAIRDGDGNVITDTYARKDHIVNSSIVAEPGFMADARLLNPNNEESPLNVLLEEITETNQIGNTNGGGTTFYQIRGKIVYVTIEASLLIYTWNKGANINYQPLPIPNTEFLFPVVRNQDGMTINFIMNQEGYMASYDSNFAPTEQPFHASFSYLAAY